MDFQALPYVGYMRIYLVWGGEEIKFGAIEVKGYLLTTLSVDIRIVDTVDKDISMFSTILPHIRD